MMIMIRLLVTIHTLQQFLQHHPSEQLGKWATAWSAEKVLDEQRQRVDDPAYARTAVDGLPQKKRLEEDYSLLC